jgi:hypothetical protein
MRETKTDVVQCTSTIVQNVHTSVEENSVVDGGGFSIPDVDGVSVPDICAPFVRKSVHLIEGESLYLMIKLSGGIPLLAWGICALKNGGSLYLKVKVSEGISPPDGVGVHLTMEESLCLTVTCTLKWGNLCT